MIDYNVFGYIGKLGYKRFLKLWNMVGFFVRGTSFGHSGMNYKGLVKDIGWFWFSQ